MLAPEGDDGGGTTTATQTPTTVNQTSTGNFLTVQGGIEPPHGMDPRRRQMADNQQEASADAGWSRQQQPAVGRPPAARKLYWSAGDHELTRQMTAIYKAIEVPALCPAGQQLHLNPISICLSQPPELELPDYGPPAATIPEAYPWRMTPGADEIVEILKPILALDFHPQLHATLLEPTYSLKQEWRDRWRQLLPQHIVRSFDVPATLPPRACNRVYEASLAVGPLARPHKTRNSIQFRKRDYFAVFYLPILCPDADECNDFFCMLAHTDQETIAHPLVFGLEECYARNHICCRYHNAQDKIEAENLWVAWEFQWGGWRDYYEVFAYYLRRKFESTLAAWDPHEEGSVPWHLCNLAFTPRHLASYAHNLVVELSRRHEGLCGFEELIACQPANPLYYLVLLPRLLPVLVQRAIRDRSSSVDIVFLHKVFNIMTSWFLCILTQRNLAPSIFYDSFKFRHGQSQQDEFLAGGGRSWLSRDVRRKPKWTQPHWTHRSSLVHKIWDSWTKIARTSGFENLLIRQASAATPERVQEDELVENEQLPLPKPETDVGLTMWAGLHRFSWRRGLLARQRLLGCWVRAFFELSELGMLPTSFQLEQGLIPLLRLVPLTEPYWNVSALNTVVQAALLGKWKIRAPDPIIRSDQEIPKTAGPENIPRKPIVHLLGWRSPHKFISPGLPIHPPPSFRRLSGLGSVGPDELHWVTIESRSKERLILLSPLCVSPGMLPFCSSLQLQVSPQSDDLCGASVGKRSACSPTNSANEPRITQLFADAAIPGSAGIECQGARSPGQQKGRVPLGGWVETPLSPCHTVEGDQPLRQSSSIRRAAAAAAAPPWSQSAPFPSRVPSSLHRGNSTCVSGEIPPPACPTYQSDTYHPGGSPIFSSGFPWIGGGSAISGGKTSWRSEATTPHSPSGQSVSLPHNNPHSYSVSRQNNHLSAQTGRGDLSTDFAPLPSSITSLATCSSTLPPFNLVSPPTPSKNPSMTSAKSAGDVPSSTITPAAAVLDFPLPIPPADYPFGDDESLESPRDSDTNTTDNRNAPDLQQAGIEVARAPPSTPPPRAPGGSAMLPHGSLSLPIARQSKGAAAATEPELGSQATSDYQPSPTHKQHNGCPSFGGVPWYAWPQNCYFSRTPREDSSAKKSRLPSAATTTGAKGSHSRSSRSTEEPNTAAESNRGSHSGCDAYESSPGSSGAGGPLATIETGSPIGHRLGAETSPSVAARRPPLPPGDIVGGPPELGPLLATPPQAGTPHSRVPYVMTQPAMTHPVNHLRRKNGSPAAHKDEQFSNRNPSRPPGFGIRDPKSVIFDEKLPTVSSSNCQVEFQPFLTGQLESRNEAHDCSLEAAIVAAAGRDLTQPRNCALLREVLRQRHLADSSQRSTAGNDLLSMGALDCHRLFPLQPQKDPSPSSGASTGISLGLLPPTEDHLSLSGLGGEQRSVLSGDSYPQFQTVGSAVITHLGGRECRRYGMSPQRAQLFASDPTADLQPKGEWDCMPVVHFPTEY